MDTDHYNVSIKVCIGVFMMALFLKITLTFVEEEQCPLFCVILKLAPVPVNARYISNLPFIITPGDSIIGSGELAVHSSSLRWIAMVTGWEGMATVVTGGPMSIVC